MIWRKLVALMQQQNVRRWHHDMSLMDQIVDMLWIIAKSQGFLMLQQGVLLKFVYYEKVHQGLYPHVFDVFLHLQPVTWLHRVKNQNISTRLPISFINIIQVIQVSLFKHRKLQFHVPKHQYLGMYV